MESKPQLKAAGYNDTLVSNFANSRNVRKNIIPDLERHEKRGYIMAQAKPSDDEVESEQNDGLQQKMWGRVKKKLRIQLGEDVYNSWFKGVALEKVCGCVVHLSVPTAFLRQWIEQHYSDRVLTLLREEQGDIESISIIVRGAMRRNKKQPAKQQQRVLTAPSNAILQPESIMKQLGSIEGPNGGASLDGKYTFESFCQGQGNNMAFTAARAVATGDRSVTFNPLYIHAKVGLGKTHLLQSIAWECHRSKLPRRVLYFTCERFMQKLRAGFATKTIAEVKERLREADIMIIDDIQFLSGDTFQQEFSHLLIALIEANKKVIVSADRSPAELTNIDERGLSRLRGGIALKLESPDAGLRRKILASRLNVLRASDASIAVSDTILDYVSQTVQTNGRDLEGALNRLVAQQCYTGAPVTLESAQLVLRDLIHSDEPRKVMIEDIQRMVAKHFNISKSDLISQRRTRAIVRPRQIAMYLCKTMTPRSLPEIGKRFGGRDHTTVIHAVQKVEQLMGEDRGFSDDVELLKRLLND